MGQAPSNAEGGQGSNSTSTNSDSGDQQNQQDQQGQTNQDQNQQSQSQDSQQQQAAPPKHHHHHHPHNGTEASNNGTAPTSSVPSSSTSAATATSSSASVQIPLNTSTFTSPSVSGASENRNAHHEMGSKEYREIGGILAGCLGLTILIAFYLYYRYAKHRRREKKRLSIRQADNQENRSAGNGNGSHFSHTYEYKPSSALPRDPYNQQGGVVPIHQPRNRSFQQQHPQSQIANHGHKVELESGNSPRYLQRNGPVAAGLPRQMPRLPHQLQQKIHHINTSSASTLDTTSSTTLIYEPAYLKARQISNSPKTATMDLKKQTGLPLDPQAPVEKAANEKVECQNEINPTTEVNDDEAPSPGNTEFQIDRCLSYYIKTPRTANEAPAATNGAVGHVVVVELDRSASNATTATVRSVSMERQIEEYLQHNDDSIRDSWTTTTLPRSAVGSVKHKQHRERLFDRIRQHQVRMTEEALSANNHHIEDAGVIDLEAVASGFTPPARSSYASTTSLNTVQAATNHNVGRAESFVLATEEPKVQQTILTVMAESPGSTNQEDEEEEPHSAFEFHEYSNPVLVPVPTITPIDLTAAIRASNGGDPITPVEETCNSLSSSSPHDGTITAITSSLDLEIQPFPQTSRRSRRMTRRTIYSQSSIGSGFEGGGLSTTYNNAGYNATNCSLDTTVQHGHPDSPASWMEDDSQETSKSVHRGGDSVICFSTSLDYGHQAEMEPEQQEQMATSSRSSIETLKSDHRTTATTSEFPENTGSPTDYTSAREINLLHTRTRGHGTGGKHTIFPHAGRF